MKQNAYLYIFIMFAVTYAIRVLPVTLLRKQITNRFVKSFLYYVPYVTLALMTFPAIAQSTSNTAFGTAAFAVGILLAWFHGNLFVCEIGCCLVVLILNLIF
ncbi:MAG: AzlD domain-containing protein [Eubacteriales bacterium]|nr:AzlD domain-containing protein [Eubacteriales bacterium]